MSGTAKLVYFWRTAVGGMVRSPFVHVIAVAALAIALVGFALARLGSAQLERLMLTLGGEVEMTAYLADGADAQQVKDLEIALAQRTGGRTRVVSPAEALGRLSAELGSSGQALEQLRDNPLPWSIEVTIPSSAREPAALKALAEKVRGLPFVTGVDYGEEALERLTAIARALKLASLVAFALVFLTTIVVVSATLQLAIYARREEIETQKLVGATDRFVRAPFLIEGMLQGLTAGALALGAVWAFVWFVSPRLAALFPFLEVAGAPRTVSPRLMLEVVGLGVGLGLLGSVVAVRRFLKV